MTLLPKMTEFHRIKMQEFTNQAEETIEAQRHLCHQESGDDFRSKEDNGRLVNFFEDQLQNQYLEASFQNSASGAIEHERQRLQSHE